MRSEVSPSAIAIMPDTTRIESDSLGDMSVPADALFGASTARAVENFPIVGRPLPARLIHALGLVKWAAATALFRSVAPPPEPG